MAHIVRIEHQPDKENPEGEVMCITFKSREAALAFIKWNQKKPSVKKATLEGGQNASGNL